MQKRSPKERISAAFSTAANAMVELGIVEISDEISGELNELLLAKIAEAKARAEERAARLEEAKVYPISWKQLQVVFHHGLAETKAQAYSNFPNQGAFEEAMLLIDHEQCVWQCPFNSKTEPAKALS